MRVDLVVPQLGHGGLYGSEFREQVARSVGRYKAEGVVDVRDNGQCWTCVVGEVFEEVASQTDEPRRADVELVEEGEPPLLPPALLRIERTDRGLRLAGRGAFADAAQLHGFATLLGLAIGAEQPGEHRSDFLEELMVGRGVATSGPLRGVCSAVLSHAVACPQQVAVEDGAFRLRYHELGALMVVNGGVLTEVVDRGSLVAVALDRGWGNLVAQLSAFHARSPVVLVDPTLPEQRLVEMFTVAQPAAVYAETKDAAVMSAARSCGLAVLDLRPLGEGDGVDLHAALAQAPDVVEDAVSHVAFTSGSTGTPKAVELRHGPMANTGAAIMEAAALTPQSRASWFCPPGVGLVEVDMFPTLLAGGTVVVAPDSLGADPRGAWRWMEEHQISHTQLPTAFAEQLIKMAELAPVGLRSMRVAGERLSVWPPASTSFQVLNVYGSTEANVVAMCDVAALDSHESVDRASIPIGRPVQNVNVYVLDERLQPLPRGAIGELCVSGRSLSRGYINRSQEHQQRFIPNPLPGDSFPVLYRSGDLARFRPDGNVEVVGRVDEETKINGTRVHPAEVEHELLRCTGVTAAAVVAHDSPGGSRVLVAYVTSQDAAESARTLKSRLAARLPAAAVPTHIVFMELPTGRNGKIDRDTLRQRPLERPDVDAAYAAPRSVDEELLCALFQEVLGLEAAVGIDDDFFALGGGSLQAAKLIERARSAAGRELDFVDLVDHSTPRALASATGDRVPSQSNDH